MMVSKRQKAGAFSPAGYSGGLGEGAAATDIRPSKRKPRQAAYEAVGYDNPMASSIAYPSATSETGNPTNQRIALFRSAL